MDCPHCGKEFDILVAPQCDHKERQTRACPYCGKCVCDVIPTDIDMRYVRVDPPIAGISYLLVKCEYLKGT